MKDLYDRNLAPPHPGEFLREDILPRCGLKRRQLAKALGLSQRVLGEILKEKRSVTFEIACCLARGFGQSPRFWLGLQAQHDYWRVAQREASFSTREAPDLFVAAGASRAYGRRKSRASGRVPLSA